MLGTLAAAVLILLQPPDTSFADYLYGRGEYEMAAGEYLRVIFQANGDTLGLPGVSLRLARCWQEMGRTEDAMEMYTVLARGLTDPDLAGSALMGQASILEETGRTAQAADMYSMAEDEFLQPDLRDGAGVMAGLMEARLGRWIPASERLSHISSRGGSWSASAARLSSVVAAGEDLPSRNPVLCGISSAILPGSGQMLCGHFTDGIIALAVNGAVGFLFISSLEEENTTTTVLLGWLGLSFYGGNIYGGARAADRYNSARRRELLETVSSIVMEHSSSPP